MMKTCSTAGIFIKTDRMLLVREKQCILAIFTISHITFRIGKTHFFILLKIMSTSSVMSTSLIIFLKVVSNFMRI